MPVHPKDADQFQLIEELSELPPSERKRIQDLTGDGEFVAAAESDMLPDGAFGRVLVVLLDDRVVVLDPGGEVLVQTLLEPLASAHCRDFVGNAVLEARSDDGRRIELARYSKSRAVAFSDLAERLNGRLGVSDDELQAQQDRIAKVSGSREEAPTYRCPNCGHPLKHSSDACPKCTSAKQVMWRLTKMMKHHWKLAMWAMVLSIVFTVCNLTPVFLVRQLIDNSLTPTSEARANVEKIQQGQLPKIPPTEANIAAARAAAEATSQSARDVLHLVIAVFVVVILIRGVSSHYRLKVMGTLGERVVTDVRSNLYRNLQRLSLSYYDREHTGRIMSRVLTDTRIIQRFVVQGLQQITVHLFMVVGIAVALVYMNWWLALIALLPIPAVVFFGKHFAGKFHRIFLSVRRKHANLSATVNETISGMRVVKSFGQEDREISGFDQKNADVYNARLAAVSAQSMFQPVVVLLIALGTIAVWWVGGETVLSGWLSLGTLILFISFTNMFYQPVRMLMNLTEAFQESATAAERIFNVMDMPSDVGDHEQAVDLDDVRGQVVIEDVSFGYNPGERVLKNVSLAVQPGEMIGLVGQTGSGKSTLVSLIARFYDPDRGRILLDGVDLRDIRTRSLRAHVGMVLQDPFLFAGTIRENIAYGRSDASDEEIIQAAKAANAHDFIMNLPDGYDSDVGERGVSLSGGEKQRVSIARAILKDPRILILDEATSAVDTATEAMIQDAMDRLVKGRTTFAIAHRLSTLRNADRLVVMEQGEVAEMGTHDELIAADGLYAELCRIQADFAQSVTPIGRGGSAAQAATETSKQEASR